MVTRKIGSAALLKAYYTRLTTHANTSSYSTYNFVPRDTSMPYIQFGAPTGVRSAMFSSDDEAAQENAVTVHVWSAYKGDKECAEMMDNIAQAMTSTALTITGYTDILCLLDYHEIILDDTEPENPVRHGVIRFVHHMA